MEAVSVGLRAGQFPVADHDHPWRVVLVFGFAYRVRSTGMTLSSIALGEGPAAGRASA
ncbi:hypothetical protein [Rubrobacter tropicus]|uniref:hypothetical protein n=1 Tax=Rubrobacter tropicus TaxID=2653851 RepID=UPI00140AA96E|nr:hypothetical protein [Rubrobacter tropicus]